MSWLVGGGVFLSRVVSAEFDLSRTGVMTSRQLGRHDVNESGWRQDQFASFGVKGHVRVGTSLHVEPTVGLVLIRTTETSSPSLTLAQRPAWSPALWHGGVMVGADLRMGWHHVGFLPGVRVYMTERPGATTWDYHYPGWTLRPSLAIAAWF